MNNVTVIFYSIRTQKRALQPEFLESNNILKKVYLCDAAANMPKKTEKLA